MRRERGMAGGTPARFRTTTGSPVIRRRLEGLRSLLGGSAAGGPVRAGLIHALGAIGEHRPRLFADLLDVVLEIAAPLEVHAIFEHVRQREALDPRSLAYALGNLRRARALFAELGVSLEGARILELGPGYSLALGSLLCAFGARSYRGVDLFPIALDSARYFLDLRRRLSEDESLFGGEDDATRRRVLERFDSIVDLGGARARFGDQVQLLQPVDAARLPFPDGSFDVVYSNAAMEHFAAPDEVIRETARVLRPGGLGLHQIDLRDHRPGRGPLEFLTIDGATWERAWRGKFNYTNRKRLGWFLEAFARAGFVDVHATRVERVDVPEPVEHQLAADFRGLPREELSAASALLVARRG